MLYFMAELKMLYFIAELTVLYFVAKLTELYFVAKLTMLYFVVKLTMLYFLFSGGDSEKFAIVTASRVIKQFEKSGIVGKIVLLHYGRIRIHTQADG